MTKPLPKYAYVTVLPAQLLEGTSSFVQLPFQSDFLLVPYPLPAPAPGGAAQNGDVGQWWAVRINSASAPELIFTNQPGAEGLAVFEGQVTCFYIRQIGGNGVLPLSFMVGTDCDIGFATAVYGPNS